MEFVSGCKITDTEQLQAWGLDLKEIAKRGMSVYLKQIFEEGFFHADPHPGNVFVKPNGKIVLIDFGMMGRLVKQQKYAFANMFVSMAQQDAKGMAIYLRRLAVDSNIEDLNIFFLVFLCTSDATHETQSNNNTDNLCVEKQAVNNS